MLFQVQKNDGEFGDEVLQALEALRDEKKGKRGGRRKGSESRDNFDGDYEPQRRGNPRVEVENFISVASFADREGSAGESSAWTGGPGTVVFDDSVPAEHVSARAPDASLDHWSDFTEDDDGDEEAIASLPARKGKAHSHAKASTSYADDDANDDEGFLSDWENYVPEEAGDYDDWDAGESRGRERASVSVQVRAFDSAVLNLRSGDGGNGCVAFRREKYVPMGGPAGGNGGRGGHVWVEADQSKSSLLHFQRQVHWRAGNGTPGSGANRAGAAGEDVVIPVPVGTVVRLRDASPEATPLAELLVPGERALLAVGGRGGRGNATFKSSTNRAPIIAEEGEAGQELWVKLEMKVGLVFPPMVAEMDTRRVLSAGVNLGLSRWKRGGTGICGVCCVVGMT